LKSACPDNPLDGNPPKTRANAWLQCRFGVHHGAVGLGGAWGGGGQASKVKGDVTQPCHILSKPSHWMNAIIKRASYTSKCAARCAKSGGDRLISLRIASTADIMASSCACLVSPLAMDVLGGSDVWTDPPVLSISMGSSIPGLGKHLFKSCRQMNKLELAMMACDNCETLGAPKRCAQCGQQAYCNRDCQVAHWKSGGHKAVCKERVS
jgi:hypothetical protein